MDLRNPDIWFAHLLENLPEGKLAAALDDDDPEWEFIDSEIVKIGSLAHSQLDVPELQPGGWRFCPQRAKTFACWRTCCVPCNIPVICYWRYAC